MSSLVLVEASHLPGTSCLGETLTNWGFTISTSPMIDRANLGKDAKMEKYRFPVVE